MALTPDISRLQLRLEELKSCATTNILISEPGHCLPHQPRRCTAPGAVGMLQPVLGAYKVGANALLIVNAKVDLSFWTASSRGIMCNALVCLAA